MKRLPIAKTELRNIVESNCLYVDKTKYIKQLLNEGHQYYFLSRPRRFGKSLFIDTMKEAFEGNKKLFEGLFLEKNWDWDVKYPVVRISFGGGTVKNGKELNLHIKYLLKTNALKHSIELTEILIPDRFGELIRLLYEKYNQSVVILIDEYDKPLLDNITEKNVNEIRKDLSSFYSVLKDASSHIKLVFLTGVSKFSRTSIFSKLNNLTDLSLTEKYADICGITQNDLETVFTDYLHDVDLQQVKKWYDGYNFLGSQLYNPYDLLMFLWEKRYKCYWFETGTPTFLLELIKKRKFFVPKLEEIKITETQLAEFEINHIQLDVLLFQTGYLTIKNRFEVGVRTYYTLKIPNLEVKIGFTDYLMNMFYGAMFETNERSGLSEKLYYAITDKKPDDMHEAFYSLFAGISSDWFRNNNIADYEGFYCTMFYVFFASLGLNIKNEDTTNKGRIDFTLTTNDSVFIFEIKMKRIEQNALQQIKERKYYEKYLSENKDIYLVGIEFDEEERNISEFEYEKI